MRVRIKSHVGCCFLMATTETRVINTKTKKVIVTKTTQKVDKYPNCAGCTVYKYCGTMVASTLLCATDNIGVATTKTAHKEVH